MAVPSGIIMFWPSTAASIPAGWTRNTDVDGKYLKGTASSTDPGDTGGSSTHGHTSPAHNHTQDSHLHSVSAGAGTGSVNARSVGTKSMQEPLHQHSAANSASATATCQTTALTVATATNDQAYYDVIAIESGGTADIPDGALAFFGAAAPSGWTAHAGSASRWLRGAAASGDGGGTGGTLGSHTHTTSAHGHTQDAHSHAAANSNTGSLVTGGGSYDTSPLDIAATTHVHSVSLGSATATTQNATATLQNSDGRPPFKKLLSIENTSGSPSLPNGVIGIWLGALASIPANWVLCDGGAATQDMRALFAECAAAAGNVGETGGSATHAHTADSHNHTLDTHSHTPSAGSASALWTDTGSGVDVASSGHTHTWTASSVVATSQATVATIDACSSGASQPPYITVAFVKYVEPGGATPYSSVISAMVC